MPSAELAGAACKLPVTAGSHVEFTGCRELTVVLSGGTDYAPNAAAHHRNHTWERLRARARDGEPDPG